MPELGLCHLHFLTTVHVHLPSSVPDGLSLVELLDRTHLNRHLPFARPQAPSHPSRWLQNPHRSRRVRFLQPSYLSPPPHVRNGKRLHPNSDKFRGRRRLHVPSQRRLQETRPPFCLSVVLTLSNTLATLLTFSGALQPIELICALLPPSKRATGSCATLGKASSQSTSPLQSFSTTLTTKSIASLAALPPQTVRDKDDPIHS